MSWSDARKLFWNPEERWVGDLFVVPAGVVVMAWVGDSYNSVLLGFAAAVPVLVLREVLYHYLVRRKRPSAGVPPNQRL